MTAEAGSPTVREVDGGDLVLTVAAVARRLGVAPPTLRTWARRYGIGPSAHVSGTHRRYTAMDLDRLRTMRRLTLSGMPAAEAARSVLGAGAGVARADPAGGHRPVPGGAGGRVVSLPGGSVMQRAMARAAMTLDARELTALVRRSLDQRGTVATWEDLIRPVLEAIGRRWETTGDGVEVEHLVSYVVDGLLRQRAHGAAEPVTGRPVLLASAPGELHHLPLSAVAAALSEHGTAVRQLGADLPPDALAAAIRRTGPCAVMLWSQSPATGTGTVLDTVPVTRPPVTVVTGGPGWDLDRLPPRVQHVEDLGDALRVLLRAAAP